MNYKTFKGIMQLALMLVVVVLMGSPSFALTKELAVVEAQWLPSGGTVGVDEIPMWGFIEASSCPTIVPVDWDVGPKIEVPTGDDSLTINLRNCLPSGSESVSIVISGQAMNDGFEPQFDANRVRSFTQEAAPNGEPRTYTWSSIKEGTYLYQSGTHVAKQVHMGLYGALAVGNYGVAKEATLLYSEIDPALHDPPATANPVNYAPKYFLINGMAYPEIPDIAIETGVDVLFRFLNAGLKTHIPTLQGLYMRVIAEDGNPYPYSHEQYSVLLAAGKTQDAILNVGNPGRHAVFDRALHRGMLAYIQAGGASGPGALQLSGATYAIAENGGTLTVTVNRIGGSVGTVSVDYATADGTATTAGNDYAAASATLNFGDGVTTQTFDITILDDIDYEGDETFNVSLSNAIGASLGTPASAVVTITDDDSGTNIPPFANDDPAQTTKNSAGITFSVTANDVDPDGTIDATTVVITSGTATQGGRSVVQNGDGTVTFIPKRGFTGTDTFTYTVNDNDSATSNTATVLVDVL